MYKLLSLLCVGFFSSLCGTQYVCSDTVLRMHKEPSEFSEVVSQIIWAEPVSLLEQTSSGWAYIASQDLTEGWVPYSSLEAFEGATVYPKPGKIAMVTSRMAHVYLIRDFVAYPPLFTLPYGAKMELVSNADAQSDRWVEVRLVHGEVAYIQRADVAINPKPLSQKDMIALAKSFIGVPYTWGGTTTAGFDAPGLCQMLYKQMGIELPRTAQDQADMPKMRQVTQADLEVGDLLFFSLKDDGQIDHVGLFIGNGDFLHAHPRNTPPSVQISSLKLPFWQASLKKCARTAGL